MIKSYVCGDAFPLEFPDGQQVEIGEPFQRDFEATTGVEHERWLLELGHIRVDSRVPVAQVTKTPSRPTPSNPVSE